MSSCVLGSRLGPSFAFRPQGAFGLLPRVDDAVDYGKVRADGQDPEHYGHAICQGTQNH